MPHAQDKISLKRIAHVYYTHKDLDKAHQFCLDFGFTVTDKQSDKIFYKGYGTAPFVYCGTKGDEDAFGGAAFVVDSMEDLELATRILPEATAIHDLDAPGGGKRVTFYDPVDGFPFHLVYGQAEIEMLAHLPELDFNFPEAKHRPVNKTQRFKHGPAPVHKLGHFGCCVTDFAKALEFYTSRFNFKPSDLISHEGKDISVFMHLDRGMEQVDHHVFFFFEGPKFHVHHSSFEVHDFDIQSLGHQWLREKNYELVWGVGRHVLGSQIFDYWYDPSKFILEHYVDGDLVNETTPIARSEAGPDNLHIWGPPVPQTFLL
ncbi:Glyoxalase/Bleomycin resistance protein/Dihydroxybiphenyl dioxygenase [Rhizodiscina lignyota]|uniref:Glyoxalase/Bleomycin resistance protein/Dihydroxybiphenyl dioxygenase n=1 Tax=Rhizodiscina lignyota TaxID=1504668 RepID=A0A9P4IIA9_9PEZI|nr:Glyoxalase/Bleomycin resistance protein/Dihydroxybiphenyl dioxygenase [Rhizodiscina lignyota]